MKNESSNNEKLTYRTEDLEKAQKRIEELERKLEQAKREAYLEAAKLVCAFCEAGNPVVAATVTDRRFGHRFKDFFDTWADCPARAIHRKLAEPEVDQNA